MKKLIVLMLLALPLQAKTLWSDFSLSYLNGSDYEVGDPDRQVVTFEYATGTTWGDSFMFIDRLESDNGDKETYAEFAPRFTVYQFDEGGFLKSLSVATTVEVGESFTHYLYGLGTSWNVPNFRYLNFNFYRRNNDAGKSNWQMTTTWGVPFNVGDSEWLYDGFLDWTTAVGEENRASSMNLTSQLKWNLAPYWGLESPLYLGVEYVFWNNKFGIDGVDERNANLLVKWHF